MNKLLFIALLMIGSVVANAQKIVTCESYNENTGEPSGIYSTWSIKQDGGYVYILYNQPKAIKGVLDLYIDKYFNGKYVPYETLKFDVESNSNWALYDYFFTEPGKYRIIALKDKTELASTEVTIKYADNASSSNSNYNDREDEDNEEVDTWYYEETEIVFGTGLDKNNNFAVQGQNDEFTIPREKGYVDVALILKGDVEFKTDLIYVDIYLGDDFIETLEVNVEPNWNIVSTNYKFTKRGTYSIEMYNADEVYINDADVEIH
ncbi:MAG: hypothetical protein H6553_11365 [Chitinophagales bacterium]|nr:hypothetical protein [Chitinophagales bacterium]